MLKILVLTFSIFFSTTAFAEECKVATEKAFFSAIEKQKIPVMELTSGDQVKFTDKFNEDKANPRLSNSAKVYFGILDNKTIGLIIMQDGCVVEGTIETLPQNQVIAILSVMGISITNLVKKELGVIL